MPHRAPIDDIIVGHLVTPPFPCFREPFSRLPLHHVLFHRRDARCLIFSDYSI